MSSDDKIEPDSALSDITVDSMGIPILSEIIDADDSALLESSPQQGAGGLNLPRRDLLLSALRQQLKAELQADLPNMVNQIAVAVAAEVRIKLEHQIRTQLLDIMEERLSTLLDNALEEHSDKWNM